MRTALLILGLTVAPALVMADAGHGNGEMAVGMPAMHGHAPSRTIDVIMREDFDKDATFVFEPSADMVFAAGKTVRLHIINQGEETHEFVMNTMEENAEHKELMAKFPEMEHTDQNAVRLEPGQEADILWTFPKAGSFEFACLLPGHYEAGMHGALTVN